jgi:hypothetical protein
VLYLAFFASHLDQGDFELFFADEHWDKIFSVSGT